MADISGEVPVPKGHVKRMAELFNEGAVSNIALPADRGRTVSMGSPGNGGERSIDRLLVASSDGNVSLEERNVLSVSRETTTTTDNGHPERSASVILSEYWNTRRRTVDAYLLILPTEADLVTYKSTVVSYIHYLEACQCLARGSLSNQEYAEFLDHIKNAFIAVADDIIISLASIEAFNRKAEQMDSWILLTVQNCNPGDLKGAGERIDNYVAEMGKLYREIPYYCADTVSNATDKVFKSREGMRTELSEMKKKVRIEARERAEKKLAEKLAPKIAELAAERGELTVVAKNTPPIGAIKKWSARPIFSSVGPLSQLRPENATERTLREVEVARPSSDTVADGASVSGSFQNASP